MRRQIDNALMQLLEILQTFDLVEEASQCSIQLDSADETAAKKWLCDTLSIFEKEKKHGWSKRDSGLLLFNAAMIYAVDVPQGAAMLLDEVSEVPS